jgi:hypothetical protein
MVHLVINSCKLWTLTLNDISLRYLAKALLGICIKLYWIVCIDFSDLEWSNFQKTDTIIIHIDIPITKTDTIISKIEIAHAYDLAHTWCEYSR